MTPPQKKKKVKKTYQYFFPALENPFFCFFGTRRPRFGLSNVLGQRHDPPQIGRNCPDLLYFYNKTSKFEVRNPKEAKQKQKKQGEKQHMLGPAWTLVHIGVHEFLSLGSRII